MKITSATYEGPDSDNNLDFRMEASIENTTESVVELIKTNVLFIAILSLTSTLALADIGDNFFSIKLGSSNSKNAGT